MKSAIARLPLWLRKFIVDAVEGSVATALALDVAIPSNAGDLRALGLAVGIGVVHALVSAARRNAPAFFAWVATQFGTANG